MSSRDDRKHVGELLHERLISGSDLTVTGEIAESFMPPLARSLAREFPRLHDPHLIDSAVADALMNLFEHPTLFEPARAGLFVYLRIRARSYLLNKLRQHKKEANKIVELDDARSVYDVNADAEATLISCEFQVGILKRLHRAFTDPEDLHVLELMVEGERKTSAFAAVLGVADRPVKRQRKLVKQAKDRINKVLYRKFGRKGSQK